LNIAPLLQQAAAAAAAAQQYPAGALYVVATPPIAKLGPRTAGVDYLYPRRRPGSART
jgi:hypothetical protein